MRTSPSRAERHKMNIFKITYGTAGEFGTEYASYVTDRIILEMSGQAEKVQLEWVSEKLGKAEYIARRTDGIDHHFPITVETVII